MAETWNSPSGSGEQPISILVVDDDPMLLRMMEIVLVDLGYAVTLASSGHDAIHKADAQHGAFDLMILDMRMPDLDGMTVLRRVHERWPSLRVLVVTGYATEGVLESPQSSGAVAVLEKPFDPATLGAVVRKALAVKPSRSEAG